MRYEWVQTLVSTAFWVFVLGVIVYDLFIKKGRNRAAAATGEDKERVFRAVRDILPAGAQSASIAAYAHWEEQEHYARSVKTTYYRYAVAFQEETLWVFPLRVDKKTRETEAGMPMIFTREKLGKIRVVSDDKNGLVRWVKIWLIDKQGEAILQLQVDAESLRSTKWYPLNIQQQEECEALLQFIQPMARKVEEENPELETILKEKNKSALGLGLSIVGAVLSILLSFGGAILCAVGLGISIYNFRKGTVKTGSLITSIVCLVVSLLFSLFSMAVMFA